MKIKFFLIALIIESCSFAQIPNNYPFVDGEIVQYSVYYNLSILWVNAASVNFCAVDSSYRGNKAIYFSSIGYSNSSYDWIFKVRDKFQSFANPKDITPLKFSRNTQEGSSKKNNYYLFHSTQNQIFSFVQENDKPLFKDTLEYSSNIYDILSATYYLRTIDFPLYAYGDTISIETIMDNEIIKLNIIYLGRESIVHKNEKKYPCYKFKTKGVEGSIFDNDSEIFVWVSEDENKIPIMIESKIIVGSVKAYIQTVKSPKKFSKIIEDFIIY